MEMKTFEIEIKETLIKVIEIEADSIEAAISRANELYGKEEIILGSENHVATDIYSVSESL